MIIWINGTYGVGKSTVANKINELITEKSKIIESDQIWLDEIKKDWTIAFGDGSYPQNNKAFLKIFKSKIEKSKKDILIIPMTVSEEYSYNYLIKPYENDMLHIILYADRDTLGKRINKECERDKSLANTSIDDNNNFLNTISNALFIDTSKLSVDDISKIIIDEFYKRSF